MKEIIKTGFKNFIMVSSLTCFFAILKASITQHMILEVLKVLVTAWVAFEFILFGVQFILKKVKEIN